MHHRTDRELIILARTGASDAAGMLFDRYWLIAWRAAYAMSADRALADDAAQDAIQLAFSSLDRFDETRQFGPWLKRIAINRAIDLLRRDRRLTILEGEFASLHGWAVSEGADRDLRLWAVADAVSALDADKRVVVVLRYWLDLPLEEIAELLEIPFGTVASRLHRAQTELRVTLEEEEEHVV